MLIKDLNQRVLFPQTNIHVKKIKIMNQSQETLLYLCQDDTGNKYMMKVLKSENTDKRLLGAINNEILILTYLKNNPHIVHLIDYFFQETRSETCYYILLEYCPNGTLAEEIAKLNEDKNCFIELQIAKIVRDVASGLKSIHNLGYSHRNLEPKNILISSEGNYKICDFMSSTNVIIENTNSNRNEIILEISQFTSLSLRAPEQLKTSNSPIDEKVDIWALGLLLYKLLFNSPAFGSSNITKQINGEYILNQEMINSTNKHFIDLLKKTLNVKPSERPSADQIIHFVETNCTKSEEELPVKKRSFSFVNKCSEIAVKMFKWHSTQFWFIKLTDPDLNPPKIKYVKYLLEKGWLKRPKLIKFFENFSRTPLHYFSSVALKSIFALHTYIVYSPSDIYSPNFEFNLDEFLTFFSSLWSKRNEGNKYDEDDSLKNANISKFLTIYSDYLLKKVAFHKQYYFLENNYSIEYTMTSNKFFDINVLVDKKYIKDVLNQFSQIVHIYSKVPIIVNHTAGILDQIIQTINDENCFIFIHLLFNIVCYKYINYKQNKNENELKEFDSLFTGLIQKSNEISEKYRKFRYEIKSIFTIYFLPNNVSEYFESLNTLIKNDETINERNIKSFFSFENENTIHDIKLHSSYGKIVESRMKYLNSLENSDIIKQKIELSRHDPLNKEYNFSLFDKFNSVKFKVGKNSNVKRNDVMKPSLRLRTDNIKELNSKTMRNMNNNNNNNEMFDIQDSFATAKSHLREKNEGDSNILDFLSNNLIKNQNENTEKKESRESKKSIPNIDLQKNDQIKNILNDFTVPQQDLKESDRNHVPVQPSDNLINKNTYNSETFKKIFQEIDLFYKKEAENENNPPNNLNPIFIDPNNVMNGVLNSLNSNSEGHQSKIINNNHIIINSKSNSPNPPKQDKNNDFTERDLFNFFKEPAKSNDHEKQNSNNNLNSSFKSEMSNINIYNIQNNITNIHLDESILDLEKLANRFLFQELSKSNLQWLIPSKNLNIIEKIGFGGSSDVFKAEYRGTEVAVKKLRINDVKDENLKEFKREVSSLVMLRHPNLVLFMGAVAEKDNICIVTEYCGGETLFKILHQRNNIVITRELRHKILLEIAIGMNFLHTNTPPIIHRDLKSLNILLTDKIERPSDNTKVKISDFGLSKIIKEVDKEKMTGQLGTCHWMAPEVIDNKEYTLKADVYSYGIIVWEIWSRKTPYGDMNQPQISQYVTIKKGRPDKNLLPPNTPIQFIQLMEKCWDDDPNKRPIFSEIIQFLKNINL